MCPGVVQAAFNLLPPRRDCKSVCVLIRSLVLGFLKPFGKPQWFSNQLRGLVFLMSDSRDGVPNECLKPLAPLRGAPSL